MSFMSFMSFLLESVQQDLSLNKNLNLSTCMYIINIIHHGKCMRTVFTHSLVCIRNLTRLISDT